MTKVPRLATRVKMNPLVQRVRSDNQPGTLRGPDYGAIITYADFNTGISRVP